MPATELYPKSSDREQVLFPERNTQIERQLKKYMSFRYDVLTDRFRTPEDDVLLTRTYMEAMLVRNTRATETQSPEVRNAVKKAKKFIHATPSESIKRVTCSDGRLLPEVELGTPDSAHKTIETPGGEIPGIVRDKNGDKIVNPDSAFGKTLKERLHKKNRIVQMLESHVGCAARKAKTERATGSAGNDDGLRFDVIDKKEMAHALRMYAEKYNGENGTQQKAIVPIQTTYDPRDGYMYMGLENDPALALSAEEGYSDTVLRRMADEGIILSTKHMVHQINENGEPTGLTAIGYIFAHYAISDFSWDSNYKGTAQQFWDNMEKMAEQTNVLQDIAQTVQKVFPDRDEKEIESRSKILMMNAYNAYHEKPIKEHQETLIVISQGENGPYPQHNAFGIINEGKKSGEKISSIDIAEGLIRSNRLNGRVENTYPDSENASLKSFVESPVPIIWKAEVAGEIDSKTLKKVDDLLESDNSSNGTGKLIPDEWYTMHEVDFREHVQNYGLSKNITEALVSLHGGLLELYAPDTTLHDRLLSRRLDVLPVLSDSRGGILTVIPFVYPGFDQEIPLSMR